MDNPAFKFELQNYLMNPEGYKNNKAVNRENKKNSPKPSAPPSPTKVNKIEILLTPCLDQENSQPLPPCLPSAPSLMCESSSSAI